MLSQEAIIPNIGSAFFLIKCKCDEKYSLGNFSKRMKRQIARFKQNQVVAMTLKFRNEYRDRGDFSLLAMPDMLELRLQNEKENIYTTNNIRM